MLATPVITGATGSVSIPAGYFCPVASSMLYAISEGGAVGTASPNSSIWLMTALGSCSAIASSASFTVDEVTTAAAAYALAPFYSIQGNIGATSTNLLGLTNAFATAATLADPVAGVAPGAALPSNAAFSAARLNSVANLLNTCTVSASACAPLFSATTSFGAPANTLDTAFKLAQNPALNVASLYTLSTASQAYAPALSSAPADWTMFITYTVAVPPGAVLPSGAQNGSPSGVAVDSQGSIWVSDYFYFASKLSPIGAPVFTTGYQTDGLNDSYGLAIDLNDNAWIPNEQPYQSPENNGSVTELSSSGTALSGAGGYIGGGLNYPIAVAIDPNGTTWVLDFADARITLLNSSGVPISGANGFSNPDIAFPIAVAIDANHFGWVANQNSPNVEKVSPDGSTFVNFICSDSPSGIAIDQGNNVWIANYYSDSVSLISNGGVILGNQTYTGSGSILRPQGIAIDGAGNVWVANYREPWLTELAGSNASTPGASLSPANIGLGGDAALLEAYALAIDASGNIWVTNQANGTVTKFVGLATPVKTPLSTNAKTP